MVAVRWSRCWACSAATAKYSRPPAASAPLRDVFWLRFLDKKSGSRSSSSKYVRTTVEQHYGKLALNFLKQPFS